MYMDNSAYMETAHTLQNWRARRVIFDYILKLQHWTVEESFLESNRMLSKRKGRAQ